MQAFDIDSLVGFIFLSKLSLPPPPDMLVKDVFFQSHTGGSFSSSPFLAPPLDKKQLKATCQIHLSIFSYHLVYVSPSFDLVHGTLLLEHFLHLASWALTRSWFSSCFPGRSFPYLYAFYTFKSQGYIFYPYSFLSNFL